MLPARILGTLRCYDCKGTTRTREQYVYVSCERLPRQLQLVGAGLFGTSFSHTVRYYDELVKVAYVTKHFIMCLLTGC
jgi:hypothetical protein